MSGLIDFHVHSGPSLAPRHHDDHEVGGLLQSVGVERFVLKAHEGTTAERAVLIGDGAVGSIVLNSPVGGANPDAVEVAARLGARVVWMPTISSAAHQGAENSEELKAHDGIRFAKVEVTRDGRVLDEWIEIIDLVAEHDMILASGHISMDEAIAVFELARRRGVTRMLVNHPMLPFLGWRDEHVEAFQRLGVHLEVGVLADVLSGAGDETATAHLARLYPSSLLVFGSDLGHCNHARIKPGITDWLDDADILLGSSTLEHITVTTGTGLLSP